MIAGIIQASGFSRRMKRDKLLMEIEGIPLVERVIKAAIESNLDELILVYRNEVLRELGKKYGLKTVYNGKAYLGQSESIKLGVKSAHDADAYMFFVGDQPYLTTELINYLIEEYKKSNLPILVPYYDGKQGMPMIMSSIYKDKLLKVVGDKGGRDIVRENQDKVKRVNIESATEGIDIDMPKDLEKIIT
ncbi:MAG: nucleotidyltransferase family protein [Tissierellaceae bacterium]